MGVLVAASGTAHRCPFSWRLERTRLELHNQTIEILSPTPTGYCTNNNETPPNKTSNLPCATDNHNISRPSFLWWDRSAVLRHWPHPIDDPKHLQKQKHVQCLKHSLDLRTNGLCADHTTSDITSHMVSRWCSRASCGCPSQAQWQVQCQLRRTPTNITHATAPSAIRILKSHQLPTSTHPVQSRSPRRTASLGRVRLPHK